MSASLLAALSSPGGAKTPVGRNSNDQIKASFGQFRQRENARLGARERPTAPAFTVPDEPPSTPGRMENLRVLIEEGKKAAAEGRLAAALRKYETALVTLPEAYKPRLRNKIARLEARLDYEEDRSPGTPARLSAKSCREAAQSSSKDPVGPLDLLRIAVQDIAAGGGEGSSSGRSSGALPSTSPRRSSPLARGLIDSRGAMPSVCSTGCVSPGNQDGGLDMSSLGDRLAVSASSVPAAVGPESYQSPTHLPAAGEDGYRSDHCHRRLQAARTPPVPETEEDDGYCGLGQAGADSDLDEVGMDAQGRLRAMNRQLSGKLEKQVVDIMNNASSAELTDLHGIGPRRAQLILQTRAATPFLSLADLSRIGMYPKQIDKMGRHNMLECLDVCSPVDSGIDRAVSRSSSSRRP